MVVVSSQSSLFYLLVALASLCFINGRRITDNDLSSDQEKPRPSLQNGPPDLKAKDMTRKYEQRVYQYPQVSDNYVLEDMPPGLAGKDTKRSGLARTDTKRSGMVATENKRSGCRGSQCFGKRESNFNVCTGSQCLGRREEEPPTTTNKHQKLAHDYLLRKLISYFPKSVGKRTFGNAEEKRRSECEGTECEEEGETKRCVGPRCLHRREDKICTGSMCLGRRDENEIPLFKRYPLLADNFFFRKLRSDAPETAVKRARCKDSQCEGLPW